MIKNSKNISYVVESVMEKYTMISVCSTLVALLSMDLVSARDIQNRDVEINAEENSDDLNQTIESGVTLKASKVPQEKRIEIKAVNLLKLAGKAKNIFIGDPEIADIQMLNDKTLYLVGLKPGTTSFIVNDENGGVILNYNITVTYSMKLIQQAIHDVYPDLNITISPLEDSIIISGKVPSPEVAKDLHEIIEKFVAADKIIDKLGVETSTQVLLKVKIAEVTRDVTKSLGIHWRALSYGKSVNGMHYGMVGGPSNMKFIEHPEAGGGSSGASTDGSTGGASSSSGSDTTDLFEKLEEEGGPLAATVGGLRWFVHSGGNNGLTGILDALANEAFASILAEPTLVTLSGTKATFKSGGEQGYTVLQTGTDSKTTEFKEWGTSIEFTPIVISEDRINITVTPKVSSVTFSNSNDNVPSLSTKEATTTVELGSGQSLAIAGLLQKSTSSTSTESPLLADIPLIGALFRSSNQLMIEKELVIIITPYIVNPSSKKLKVPTDMVPKLYSPLGSILTRSFNENSHTHEKGGADKIQSGFSIK